MEDRTVYKLKELWWTTKNKRIDENGNLVNCTKTAEVDETTPPLEFENVVGVFLVLFIGIGVAILAGISEFIWNVRQISVTQRVTTHSMLN